MRLWSSANRSMGFIPVAECTDALYTSSSHAVNWRLSIENDDRSRLRERKWSRTVRKNLSILPFAAPSRTGVCRRMVPTRPQIRVISWPA